MQVRLLGSVDIMVDGVARPVAGLRRKAVLAVLGLTAGEIVSTDRLIDIVWGGEEPTTASNTLQSHVSYLRRVLGRRTAIVARAPGYLLDIGAEATDLQVAEGLIRRAERESDPARVAAHLRAALDLWRGQPLVDVAGQSWLDEQADRLSRIRQEAAHALVEARLAMGEHTQLVAELELLVQEQPFAEHVHGQLMLALYRSGRQADALGAYQRLRRSLGDELGIDPSPALRDLEAAILRQDAGLSPAPQGPRRQIAQALVEGTAPPTPARPEVAVPAQLPATVEGFVGRQAQLAQLDAFLAAAQDGGSPMMVIAAIGGTAGIGKTSLAVHWARLVRDRFPDGQLHLNLRGYANAPPIQPGQALAQFLRALGVPSERVPLDQDEAAAMYRTLLADRRMLVILDNAASPEQVRPLLPGSPHCLVLITSRDRLGGLIVSEGARLLALDVLDPAEAEALLAGIVGAPRAGAEPEALAELARLCGYLPLALRIAAANLVMRPRAGIAEYVADLREADRLTVLRVDGDERSAVRGAFDLSYTILEPAEQSTFRLLGLVPGPDIDVLAAAALAGTSPERVRRALSRLVDGHLVDEPAPGRFAFHDLLRLYARSLADAEDGPDEVAAAKERLAAFYVSATEAAANLLYPGSVRLPAAADRSDRPPPPAFADHIRALDWLETERANLVALVHEAVEGGPRRVAWQLADNLRGYFYLRRYGADWFAVSTDALLAAEGQPGPQALAHLSLGDAYNAQGMREPAIANLHAALALAELAGWAEGQAAVLNNLGVVHSMSGQHRESADYFSRGVAVHERSGRLVGQAIGLDNLGIVRRELGQLAAAAELHTRAIALHRQTGFAVSHANALTNLATVVHDFGRLDEAMRIYHEAWRLHQQNGNSDRQAMDLFGIAAVHRDAGRHEQALEYAGDALTLAREIGDLRTEAHAAMTLASVYAQLGRYESALDRHQHALRLAVQTDSRVIRARALLGVAEAQRGLDDATAALATVGEALALIRDNGYRALEVDALTVLARIHSGHDQSGLAAAAAQEALALSQEIGYGLGEERVRRTLRGLHRPEPARPTQ